MLTLLRDAYETLCLKSRYRRLMQERVLDLLQAEAMRPAREDGGRWHPVGATSAALPEPVRQELRSKARRLVEQNPYARNLLRLLESYVTGPGLKLTPVLNRLAEVVPHGVGDGDTSRGERVVEPLRDEPPGDREGAVATLVDWREEAAQERWLPRVDAVWQRFLVHNRRHFSYREYATRTWRDGECFLRIFPAPAGPPSVRFVDPEQIGSPAGGSDVLGIETTDDDIETVLHYQLLDDSGRLLERIPAAQMLHTRLSADSNEKRGLSWFSTLVEPLESFDRWLDVELQARKLQASIVLWRKVQGSPSQIANAVQTAGDGSVDGMDGSRRERWRAGTILTTSQGTDLQFLQPQTNFGDAVPLGRLLLLSIAAGTGLPEYMLTCDASNANFASTMVAEGPAVKLFESQQHFFGSEWEQLWRLVVREAIEQGELPRDTLAWVRPQWSFPQLVNRDRSQERQTDARLIETGVLSRAEVARRDGVDPSVMRRELRREEADAAAE